MTARIFAYVSHTGGVPDDSASELQVAAKMLDAGASTTAIVSGFGPKLDAACSTLQNTFGEIWKISNEALAYPNAEMVRKALLSVIPRGSIVLLSHSHFGVDLGPGLSVKLESAYVSDVMALEGIKGSNLKVVRQEFGGQASAHVTCDLSSGAVLTLRPGIFKATENPRAAGTVIDKSSSVVNLSAGRRYLETIAPEAGDVDISKEACLVSIGRGIQEPENVAIAQALADAIGAAVSCSRPVVDAKWLPKSRQVGSSGQTVKPKVYMACGISGSFQHLAGLKGNPFIIAINKNPKAPIFHVADVGVVDDLLEFLPAMTTKIQAMMKVK